MNIKEKRRKHKTIFNQKFLNKFVLTKDLLDIENKLSKYIQKHCELIINNILHEQFNIIL